MGTTMKHNGHGRVALMDPMQVLRPDAGIAASVAMSFDDDFQLWTVSADVGLGRHKGSEALARVGACGFGRAETLVRAAGEAVERFALMPPDGGDTRVVPAVPAGQQGRMPLGLPGVGRCATEVDLRPTDCLPAIEAGQPQGPGLLLPCAAVNDPIDPAEVGLFDPGPSGAAAGGSWDDAVLAALLESVERDAVQAAWTLRPPLGRLEHPTAMRALNRADRACRLLAEVVADQGLELSFVLIPTDVMSLMAVIGVILDRSGHGMVAAGCAVSASPLGALRRAGREALQVLAALRSLSARGVFHAMAPVSAPDQVVDELSRAHFWTSPTSVPLVEEWLGTFLPMDLDPGPDPGDAEVTLVGLTSALRSRGMRPLACDLTYRLPAEARNMGWHVAKAIVLGHQSLRMDERHTFTWCHDRLAGLAHWWKCDFTLGRSPHPFI